MTMDKGSCQGTSAANTKVVASNGVPNNPRRAWTLPAAAKQLKENIEEKLDKIDQIAKEMVPDNCAPDKKWTEAQTKASAIGKKLRPYLAAFESQAFFIVTFGMLKAGKSTLVNALVGKKDLSPVGHGIETTKRSSIICAADEKHPEGVYIYTPRGTPEEGKEYEWRSEKCKTLLLALGGVGNVEEEFLEEGPKDLSEKDDLLVKRPWNPDELPPVIRIKPCETGRFPGENLLRDGVAILDTPGLDGIDANAKNDAFWQVLPAQGDFFLLVQSSMSGLNDDCATQIANIYKRTEKEPKISIVYNEIASQFWLKDEIQKESLQKDQDDVAKHLKETLKKVAGAQSTMVFAVNAGAASAALFGSGDEFSDEFSQNPKKLLEQSHLVDLTKKLRQILQTQRMEIKLERLKGLMGKELAGIQDEINQCRRNLAADDPFKERKGKRVRARESVGELRAAFCDPTKKATIVDDIVSALDGFVNPKDAVIETAVKNVEDDLVLSGNPKKWVSQKTCEDAIDKIVKKVNSNFSTQLADTIKAGAGILQVQPWKGFTLPKGTDDEIEKIAKYLDDSTKDSNWFRLRLLSALKEDGINRALGYQIQDVDKKFPIRFHWFRKGEVIQVKDWSGYVQGLHFRLKLHFGLVPDNPKCTAIENLEKYVGDSILKQWEKTVVDFLEKLVSAQGEKEEDEEAAWKDQKEKTDDALQRINTLVTEIRDKLK